MTQIPTSSAPKAPTSTGKANKKRLFIIAAVIVALLGGLAVFVVPAAIETHNSIGIKLEKFNNGTRRSSPHLTIDAGNAEQYTLNGAVLRADEAPQVTVNDIPATMDGNDFSVTIPLKDGSNEVTVRAVSGEKTSVRTVRITTNQ